MTVAKDIKRMEQRNPNAYNWHILNAKAKFEEDDQIERMKKQNEEIAGQRKSMVGSGDRSDKIRTYNYPQARVTDHRINYTVYNLTEIVSGDLFSFTEKLRIAENAEKMKSGNND